MFQGAYTALITPFSKGALDEKAFVRLIEWQIRQGIHGLVPAGTTGEAPTLSFEEHKEVITLCVKATKGRVPVIAGTGANATEEAIQLTLHAQKAGANGALIVAPYYNKPTQEGMLRHFKAIHDATRIPVMLYNVPARTVVDMQDALIARLAELPRIIGIKDATGNLERPQTLGALLSAKAKKRFIQFSGEDATAVAFNLSGGKGVISVTANLAPKLCAALQEASLKGDYKTALKLQQQLLPLHKAMFVETSPAPVKYAAHLMGLCSRELRLPMTQASPESQKKIAAVLRAVGLASMAV